VQEAIETNLDPEAESSNPPRKGIKKGLYLIPAAFTAGNIGMGFFSVMSTLRGFQLVGIGEIEKAAVHFDYAAIAIGWAVLFDGLDGRVARMTKTTTEIGVQFDSIADVLTFGIAPAILVYSWGYGSALAEGTNLHKMGWLISFLYLMCGAFRLARFNVQASRPRVLAEGSIKVDKKSFVGLPIPLAASLIAAIIHFSPSPILSYEHSYPVAYSTLMIALVGLLSALMVSTIRYTSFKSVGMGKRGMHTILGIAIAGMLLYLYSKHFLLVAAAAYVAHGPILRFISGFRRSHVNKQETTEIDQDVEFNRKNAASSKGAGS
jgi:CDP-diacylglycerol---serine O-phosphatidyltransferase